MRRWKLILNILTFIALALFVVFFWSELGETIKNLGKVNAWALLLLIPIQMLNYHAQTKMYQGMFEIVGNKLKYWYLMMASIELNFVNHVFSSGGAAGISYFGLRMKDEAITGAKATLIQVMKMGLLFLSFEVVLIFGMFLLAIDGKVNNLVILVGTAISTLLLVGAFAFVYIVGSKRRINSFFTGVVNAINWFINLFRKGWHETINVTKAREVFEDFHDNYNTLRKSLPQLKSPFWYAVLANLTEILAIYAVFFAFGYSVNFGAVILAYGVANFAGLVSVAPGGAGVYEFLMTAVLATAGVPAAVSIPVIIMYRVVNTTIQVPIGYYFYQRTLKRA